MITVHHLENSRSQRVLWLLEELDLPYEVVRYARDPETLLAPPALREVHPLGKSPVITDGETTVAESGAILEYLVDSYGSGRFRPKPGTPAYQTYRYFLHYAEGSLMPLLVMRFVFGRVKAAKLPFFVKPVARKIADGVDGAFLAPNLRRHLAFLETALSPGPWLAGEELTAADVQMSYPLEALVERAADLGVPAPLVTFVERVRSRPAYARALEKGGPSGPV